MNTDDIDTMYREAILDLYRNPLNKKELADFDVEHRELNPTCGDEISVQIKFDQDGKIKDIGHQGYGCAISQAAVSLLTDEIKGKSKNEIENLKEQYIYGLLGFEPVYTRLKCAKLGLKVIQNSFNK